MPEARNYRRRLHAALAVPVAVLLALASTTAANAAGVHPVSVGLPPTAVALDRAAHTAYVATSDGVSAEVAVIDTAHCVPVASTSCTGPVAAVHLQGGSAPAALAYDATDHTLFVADANSGGVAMVDALTCNATKHAGCGATPKTVALDLTAPSAIAVDTSHHADAVYVADGGGSRVRIFDAGHCNATRHGGCAKTRTVGVGSAPSAIAVDASTGSVYVANLGGNTITVLSRAACSALKPSCHLHRRTISLGAGTDPTALLVDSARHTLYVADGGTNSVAFVNIATCNSSRHSGCGKRPHPRAGFAGAAGLALASGRIVVVATSSDRVVDFSAARCNATKRSGCGSRTTHQLPGSPVAIAASGHTAYVADSTGSSLDILHV